MEITQLLQQLPKEILIIIWIYIIFKIIIICLIIYSLLWINFKLWDIRNKIEKN